MKTCVTLQKHTTETQRKSKRKRVDKSQQHLFGLSRVLTRLIPSFLASTGWGRIGSCPAALHYSTSQPPKTSKPSRRMSSSPPSPSSPSFVVKFVPFSSTVDSPFWVQYNHLKLERIRLDEGEIPIRASYSPAAPVSDKGISNNAGNNAVVRMQCQESSLRPAEVQLTAKEETTATGGSAAAATIAADFFPSDRVASLGYLKGLNTMESFQRMNKNTFLQEWFVKKFCNIGQGKNEDDDAEDIGCLTSFVILTFADLKQHKVVYWFAFPAFLTKQPISATIVSTSDSGDGWFGQLPQLYHNLRKEVAQQQGDDKNGNLLGLPPYFVLSKTNPTKMVLLSINCLEEVDITSVEDDKVIFGFLDPVSPATADSSYSVAAQQQQPPPPMGWPLRNLIAYLSYHLNLGGSTVSIVSFRPHRLDRFVDISTANAAGNDVLPPTPASLQHGSLVFRLQVPTKEAYSLHAENEKPKVVGWEWNPKRNKPSPRIVNLRPLLDNTHLAIQAADLNLKLMKWRMIPQLNVSRLQTNTKVLLLGAGTLGCSVARTLLGWGVRHFTFVDYGTVSYSNPVRQNLFTLEDCHYDNGTGKPKAQAAADALGAIAADVHATAHKLSIPMPGHPDTMTKEQLRDVVTKLDTMIKECDVVYLLTDTRESRWLPTVMAAAHDKILINAALGLDSWLVMRHGGGITPESAQPQQRLGCYFCNDVVAPENSTKNRTLDQQCTVTRPGLAPIASSMAVELMVSMMHHPLQQRAPAIPPNKTTFSNTVSSLSEDNSNNDGVGTTTAASTASPLGVMPHQIRGSLVSYTMMTPTVPAFVHCTACSVPTIREYQNNTLDFVYQACQSTTPQYLEDLSGLTQFRHAADKALEEMLADDDVDEDDF